MVDARGICLRQRNTKAGRAERECFGGKLFFYKIEEVLVTSAGQCAGARVNHGACSLMSRDQRCLSPDLEIAKNIFRKNFSSKTN